MHRPKRLPETGMGRSGKTVRDDVISSNSLCVGQIGYRIDDAADVADAEIIRTCKIATAVYHWLYESMGVVETAHNYYATSPKHAYRPRNFLTAVN